MDVVAATSSSGSEQSHWSSSGSDGRVSSRAAPPIPPWPAAGSRRCGTWSGLREDSGTLQCWVPRPAAGPNAPNKPRATSLILKQQHQIPAKALRRAVSKPKLHKESDKSNSTSDLIHIKYICDQEKCTKLTDDNPSLSDMDNGNDKTPASGDKTKSHRPVFTKHVRNNDQQSNKQHAAAPGLSLLQIYMRQRSQTQLNPSLDDGDIPAATTKKVGGDQDVIASGGGEGWVEDYPSSADEKLGMESVFTVQSFSEHARAH